VRPKTDPRTYDATAIEPQTKGCAPRPLAKEAIPLTAAANRSNSNMGVYAS